MEDSLGRLVDQLFTFFTTHFYEILLIIRFWLYLTLPCSSLSQTKKTRS